MGLLRPPRRARPPFDNPARALVARLDDQGEACARMAARSASLRRPPPEDRDRAEVRDVAIWPAMPGTRLIACVTSQISLVLLAIGVRFTPPQR